LDSESAGPFRRLQTIELTERFPIGALDVARASHLLAIGALDGRVALWDMGAGRVLRCVSTSAASVAGVLQELRLSPLGAIVMAWGYQLGVHIWSAVDGATLWRVSATAPSGMMDAVLFDTPAMVRMASPQAPIALAAEDPFRWAHEGRFGTAVHSRPLAGPVAPGWAVPLECTEEEGGRFGPHAGNGPGVQLRALAEDGRRLLTSLVQPDKNGSLTRELRVWDLDHRSLRGAAQPKVVRTFRHTADGLDFPIAFTPDLSWCGAARGGRELVISSLREKKSYVIRSGPVSPDARLILSPDGSYVALAHGATLRLWRVASGQLQQSWRAPTEVGPIAFARRQNAHLLAAGLADGLVEVWTS
jgi:WD40 repeat protein